MAILSGVLLTILNGPKAINPGLVWYMLILITNKGSSRNQDIGTADLFKTYDIQSFRKEYYNFIMNLSFIQAKTN